MPNRHRGSVHDLLSSAICVYLERPSRSFTKCKPYKIVVFRRSLLHSSMIILQPTKRSCSLNLLNVILSDTKRRRAVPLQQLSIVLSFTFRRFCKFCYQLVKKFSTSSTGFKLCVALFYAAPPENRPDATKPGPHCLNHARSNTMN